MNDDIMDKLNILYFKNRLINAKEETLKELHSDPEEYAYFLDSFLITLYEEPAFFLLDDELIRKAQAVVENKRYDYRNPEYYDAINEIIRILNIINSQPRHIKEMQASQYIKWQEKMRETSFRNTKDLLKNLSSDAVVLECVKGRELDIIDSLNLFRSTNYLVKTIPEFYQEDEGRIDITLSELKKYTIRKNSCCWSERFFARGAIKNVEKVKTKEE